MNRGDTLGMRMWVQATGTAGNDGQCVFQTVGLPAWCAHSCQKQPELQGSEGVAGAGTWAHSGDGDDGGSRRSSSCGSTCWLACLFPEPIPPRQNISSLA